MTRKRRCPPIDRPDWRDPAMKPLAQHKTRGLEPVDPQFMSGMAAFHIANDDVPTWREDETYDLRRR
jgi:hypothetical protein